MHTLIYVATPLKDPLLLGYELRYQEESTGNLVKVHLEGGVCEQYERYLILAAKEEDRCLTLAA